MIGEENLVQELKNKNPLALDYLTDNYGSLLMRVAFSVLKDREKSLACVKEALFNIWDNIDCFKGDLNRFKCWIVIITKSMAEDKSKCFMKNNLNLRKFLNRGEVF